MTPIDHFSKYKPGEIILQISLFKTANAPFVEFKGTVLPQDGEAGVNALFIASHTLTAMLANATGKTDEFQQISSSLESIIDRAMPTKYADEELR